MGGEQKYTPIRLPRRGKRESAATPPPRRSGAQGRPTHNPPCNQLATTASRVAMTSVGGCRRQQTPGGSACFDGLHGDGVETSRRPTIGASSRRSAKNMTAEKAKLPKMPGSKRHDLLPLQNIFQRSPPPSTCMPPKTFLVYHG